MHDFKCQRCGECCKRYYIISLPSEVQEQARFKGLGQEEFMDRHCQLFLQLFPFEQNEEKPVVSKNFLPKRIAERLEKEIGVLPEYFIVMPMICFQRHENGACTFYYEGEAEESPATGTSNALAIRGGIWGKIPQAGQEKAAGCTIYGARPLECRLFPFISLKKNANYAELYPFCHGLHAKGEKLNYVDLSFVHFRQVGEYMNKVKEKGFKALWGNWPKKGVLLYKDKAMGEISEEEFFQAIEPYK